MTAPFSGDDGPILVRAVWVDEATGGLRALRGEMAQTTAIANRAGVGLTMAQGASRELGRAATGAHPGVNQLRTALVVLGSQAAGVPTLFGRMASSMLLLSTGGAATLALVGGATAASIAIAALGKETREAREEHEKLLESIRKRAEAEHPEQQLAKQEAEQRAEIAKIDREIANLRGVTLHEMALEGEDLAKHQREEEAKINELLAKRHELDEGLLGLQRDLEKARGAERHQLEEIVALPPPAWLLSLTGGLRGLAIPGAEIPPGAAFAPEGPTFRPSQMGLGRSAGLIVEDVFGLSPAEQAIQDLRREGGVLAIAMDELNVMFELGEISAQERKVAEDQLRGSMEESTISAGQLATAVGNMIAGLIRGPSASGILGTIGGIASIIPGGQLVGGILMGGAAIAGALESRNRDRGPVEVADRGVRQQLQGLREDIREILTSETVVTGDPSSVRDIELARQRLARRGVVTHFPRGR